MKCRAKIALPLAFQTTELQKGQIVRVTDSPFTDSKWIEDITTGRLLTAVSPESFRKCFEEIKDDAE